MIDFLTRCGRLRGNIYIYIYMYLQVNKGEQFEGERRKVTLWRLHTYRRSWFCLTVALHQLSITRLSLLLQFSMFFASTFVRPLVRG